MFFRTVKKIWTDFSSVLSQCTRLTDRRIDRRTDGRTDRQTEISSLDRVCIPCSAVKRTGVASQLPRFLVLTVQPFMSLTQHAMALKSRSYRSCTTDLLRRCTELPFFFWPFFGTSASSASSMSIELNALQLISTISHFACVSFRVRETASRLYDDSVINAEVWRTLLLKLVDANHHDFSPTDGESRYYRPMLNSYNRWAYYCSPVYSYIGTMSTKCGMPVLVLH